jgi:hypothetical protein
MRITESQLRKIVRQEISESHMSLQESPGGGGWGGGGYDGTGGGGHSPRRVGGAGGGGYSGGTGDSLKDMQYYRYLMPNLFLALEKEIRTRSPHLTWQYLTQKITRLSDSGSLENSRMKELESMYNDGLVSVYDVLKELGLSS